MSRRWYDNPWVWGGGLLAGAGLAFIPDVRFAVNDLVVRGELVTSADWYAGDEKYGYIDTDPESLAAMASLAVGVTVDTDEYSVARMIRSEGARQGLVRAHVAMNDLATFPYASTLTGLLTYSTDTSRRGYYGKQYSPAVPADPDNGLPAFPAANKRRYSTAHDPYDSDVQLARQAIAERATGVDRVNGATKFVDKSSMGVQLGSGKFDALDAKWRADGLVPFTLAELDDDLVFYKKG